MLLCGCSPKRLMMRAYINPMLTQQASERFGVRDFLQEHLFGNPPIVSPEAVLESNIAMPKTDVLTTLEVGAVEYETPKILFEYRINGYTIKNPSKILQGVDLEFEFTLSGTDPGADVDGFEETLL